MNGEERIRVTGELDHATTADLEARIAAAEAARPETLVLDLRDLSFIDSTGVRVLLAAARRARAERRRLRVETAEDGQVIRAFRLMRIDARLAAAT